MRRRRSDLLAIGLAVAGLIEDLFARSQELGWLGLVLAILATVSVVVIGVREAIGLLRLSTMERLHRRAADKSLATIASMAARLCKTSLPSRGACHA